MPRCADREVIVVFAVFVVVAVRSGGRSSGSRCVRPSEMRIGMEIDGFDQHRLYFNAPRVIDVTLRK